MHRPKDLYDESESEFESENEINIDDNYFGTSDCTPLFLTS